MTKIYWDRQTNTFYRNTGKRLFDYMAVGTGIWQTMSTVVDTDGMEDWEASQCDKGHDRTPENLMMGNDGYLRCKLCRKIQSQKKTKARDIVVDFNSNSSVQRDQTKPGWGEVLLSLRFTKGEAKRLGETLIRLTTED